MRAGKKLPALSEGQIVGAGHCHALARIVGVQPGELVRVLVDIIEEEGVPFAIVVIGNQHAHAVGIGALHAELEGLVAVIDACRKLLRDRCVLRIRPQQLQARNRGLAAQLARKLVRRRVVEERVRGGLAVKGRLRTEAVLGIDLIEIAHVLVVAAHIDEVGNVALELAGQLALEAEIDAVVDAGPESLRSEGGRSAEVGVHSETASHNGNQRVPAGGERVGELALGNAIDQRQARRRSAEAVEVGDAAGGVDNGLGRHHVAAPANLQRRPVVDANGDAESGQEDVFRHGEPAPVLAVAVDPLPIEIRFGHGGQFGWEHGPGCLQNRIGGIQIQEPGEPVGLVVRCLLVLPAQTGVDGDIAGQFDVIVEEHGVIVQPQVL